MIINPTPEMLKDGWNLSGNELYFTNKQGVNLGIRYTSTSQNPADGCYMLITDCSPPKRGKPLFEPHSTSPNLFLLAQIASHIKPGQKGKGSHYEDALYEETRNNDPWLFEKVINPTGKLDLDCGGTVCDFDFFDDWEDNASPELIANIEDHRSFINDLAMGVAGKIYMNEELGLEIEPADAKRLNDLLTHLPIITEKIKAMGGVLTSIGHCEHENYGVYKEIMEWHGQTTKGINNEN